MGSWGPSASQPQPLLAPVSGISARTDTTTHPPICPLPQPHTPPSLVREAREGGLCGQGLAQCCSCLAPLTTLCSTSSPAVLSQSGGLTAGKAQSPDRSCSLPLSRAALTLLTSHCPFRYLGRLEGGPPGKLLRVSCEESWSFLTRGKLRGASHSQTVKIGGHSHQPLPNLTPLFWTLPVHNFPCLCPVPVQVPPCPAP